MQSALHNIPWHGEDGILIRLSSLLEGSKALSPKTVHWEWDMVQNSLEYMSSILGSGPPTGKGW